MNRRKDNDKKEFGHLNVWNMLIKLNSLEYENLYKFYFIFSGLNEHKHSKL